MVKLDRVKGMKRGHVGQRTGLQRQERRVEGQGSAVKG